MRSFLKTASFLTCFVILWTITVHAQETEMNELYRPQYHFTPAKNWNNDPNGLVFYKGEYHLFYQYYPEAMVWGPMHWGHAVSTDLLHWKTLPIALYPDSIGYIYSGSAVVDEHNSSGFQTGQEKPLVAIFTYHNPATNQESQAIAYSNDKGRHWEKYAGNPVIANLGLSDFRDPKVRWFEPLKKWIMVVSCHDYIGFYSSPDLKEWTKESEFGKDKGSHGGVWECPDLFPLKVENTKETKWVLTVNNNGSPAGGGGTQYFIGKFDGHVFTADDDKTRWLDGGADEYAGITWSNTGKRTVFIGWMNNWPEANKGIPSYIWRGGMTLPMELTLKKMGDGSTALIKRAVREISSLENSVFAQKNISLQNGEWTKEFKDKELSSSKITMKVNMENASKIILSLGNDQDQHMDIIYDKEQHQLVIDRTHADSDNFHASSARRHTLDIPDPVNTANLIVYYDRSTVEVFFDNGRYITTDLVFPAKWYNRIDIKKTGGTKQIDKVSVSAIKSVWR